MLNLEYLEFRVIKIIGYSVKVLNQRLLNDGQRNQKKFKKMEFFNCGRVHRTMSVGSTSIYRMCLCV